MPTPGEGFGSPWWCCACQTLKFGGEPGVFWRGGSPMVPTSTLNPLLQWFVDYLGPSGGCRGGAERWQLRAGLPAKSLALRGLFPKLSNERARSCSWESCPQCWGGDAALLSASSEPPASSTGLLGA